MPLGTLHFATDIAREMLDMRQQAEAKELPDEQACEAESRYIRVIDSLAGSDELLAGIPELIGLAEKEALDDMAMKVLCHLIFRALQDDWQHQWFEWINAHPERMNTLEFVACLPDAQVTALLPQMFNAGRVLREWAQGYCVRNNTDVLNHAVMASYPCSRASVTYLRHFLLPSDMAFLHRVAADEQQPLCIRFSAVQGIVKTTPEALSYLRLPSWLLTEENDYGFWLVLLGSKADLRLLESSLEMLLQQYAQTFSGDLFKTITQSVTVLSRFGDKETLRWMYKHVLHHNEGVVRFLGFNTMLALCQKEAQANGEQWLNGTPVVQHEQGEYRLFTFAEANTFWVEQERCYGAGLLRLDIGQQLAPANLARSVLSGLDECSYGDVMQGERLQTLVGYLVRQNIALDTQAPYSRFVQQKALIRQVLERFAIDE